MEAFLLEIMTQACFFFVIYLASFENLIFKPIFLRFST